MHNLLKRYTTQLINKNVRLAWDLAFRDLKTKYKRSIIGIGWYLLVPLTLLGIYTFVFSYVLGVTWETKDPSKVAIGYVLPFFAGLSVYLMVSDVAISSSNLFVSKRTFVLKSPFPIWVLWLSNLFRAFTIASISFFMLFVIAGFKGTLSISGLIMWLLLIFHAFIIVSFFSLLIACLSPFVGDLSELVRLFMRAIFYATPISYPLSYLKPSIQTLLWLNPLTWLIEPLRNALIYGQFEFTNKLIFIVLIELLIAFLSLWIYKRLESVIPDVV